MAHSNFLVQPHALSRNLYGRCQYSRIHCAYGVINQKEITSLVLGPNEYHYIYFHFLVACLVDFDEV